MFDRWRLGCAVLLLVAVAAPRMATAQRCQECSWFYITCTDGLVYESCQCRNTIDGNRICQCRADRRNCQATCEERGGACPGSRLAAATTGGEWFWSLAGSEPAPVCMPDRADGRMSRDGAGADNLTRARAQ
jgi:hypothetical protein